MGLSSTHITKALRLRSAWKAAALTVFVSLAIFGAFLDSRTAPTLEKSYASIPDPWARIYGGTGSDYAQGHQSVQQTSDGGFVVAGQTSSFGAGSSDAWVLRLDSSGRILWQKTYGGTGYDQATSIQQTSDGGYVLAIYITPAGGGTSTLHIFKLDSGGSVVWEKSYDKFGATMIRQTSDGGFVVAGSIAGLTGIGADLAVVRLNSTGGILWQKSFGGSNPDGGDSVQQTSDGGFIVGGFTSSFGAGGNDFWVLQLNSTGGVVWQKTFGGNQMDAVGASVIQTSDGGFILSGSTESFGVAGDFWVIRLNSSGGVLWQKTYGGTSDDEARAPIQQTADGGFYVVGLTQSFGAVQNDAWVLRLDSAGGIVWQKRYGTADNDFAWSDQLTSDGGLIIAGQINSASGADLWVLRLDSSGNISNHCTLVSTTTASAVNTSAGITTPTVSGADIGASATSANTPEKISYSSPQVQCESTPVFDFSITVSPNSSSVVPGNTLSPAGTVTMTILSSVVQSATLSIAGLPSNVGSEDLTGKSCKPTCSTSFQISTLASAPAGNYTLTITGTGGGISHSTGYNLTVSKIPDVAVSAMVPSRNFAYSGVLAIPIVLNVTASNLGTGSETFFVSAKANSTLIGNQTVTLSGGGTMVVSFSWETGSLARGNYLLTANATRVTGETNFSNNNLTGGTFKVKLKGDVSGDCLVNIVDLASVGSIFGMTIGRPGYGVAADQNNDGQINIVDLSLVGSFFGQSC